MALRMSSPLPPPLSLPAEAMRWKPNNIEIWHCFLSKSCHYFRHGNCSALCWTSMPFSVYSLCRLKCTIVSNTLTTIDLLFLHTTTRLCLIMQILTQSDTHQHGTCSFSFVELSCIGVELNNNSSWSMK
jgi:hypothetical protein